MADFTLVDPKGWEYDLHSVYSAYMGYFQIYNVPWYDRSWGHMFESFEEFLAFSWPVITVTDALSGRAHIVTRLNSIGAFLKMIKTRFGETLPQAPNILQITPFETTSRHLRNVSDYSSYKKLHSTLPAVVLSAIKARVKSGDPKTIKEIWEKRDKTFLAISFEVNERNEKSVLEWGYAAVRCAHLDQLGHWPPIPDTNYRKGHYIVADYVDKVINKYSPNYPWQYVFGESQVIPKIKLPQIIQSVISSLASPDSETTPNQLVLVGHNIYGSLARLDEMKIKIPHNMLIIDTMVYERALYSNGLRGVIQDPKSDKARLSGSSLSFENFLFSLTLPLPLNTSGKEKAPAPPLILPQCTLHNSGNDAFLCLLALQKLLEPTGTAAPSVRKLRPMGSMPNPAMLNMAATIPMINFPVSSPMLYPVSASGSLTPASTPPMSRPATVYDLASEFGQMQLSMGRGNSGGATHLTAPSRLANGRRLHSFPGLQPKVDDTK
ncbi:hypothetical protein BDN70DRAFT_934643 [Pholiota conissans]|uniref:Gfd2/YDR514C-like C-terminal domain-containing protein n=1 Tax=Pholiota conissans TaxID=109636 RepID=A0A9P5YZX6_9AGAR|nr:hypothetical protein BDN70DRAFT_934643 [Pholiota conissans]